MKTPQKNKDNPKNYKDPKNKDTPKNYEDPKNEDNPKNEDDIFGWVKLPLKMSSHTAMVYVICCFALYFAV